MNSDQRENECDAGDLCPSPKKWRVVFTHGHKTLKLGDIVVCDSPAPGASNYLVRTSDFTVHSILGESEQYVHLVPA